MTFTPETGDGIEGANAFVDLAFCLAYHESVGQAEAWAGTSVSKTITAASSGADSLTVADHGFVTGDGPLRLVGADLPAGLVALTDYWIVRLTASTFSLATSYANAIAATPVVIDLTDAGSGSMTTTAPDFAAQRAAIVRATAYVVLRWGARFKGDQATLVQGLPWPRLNAYQLDAALGRYLAIDGLPEGVKRATAEYALRARSASLVADTGAGGTVVNESRSKGGISRSVSYSSASVFSSYPAADRQLDGLINPPYAVRY